MSDLGLYLCKHTDFCAETRNLIEDVINGVQNNAYLGRINKEILLKNMLQGMGFTKAQLHAFADGKIPQEYEIIPVNVCVRRFYRVYVRVQKGLSDKEVRNATIDQILQTGLSDCDLAGDMDIDADDIVIENVDYMGAHDE